MTENGRKVKNYFDRPLRESSRGRGKPCWRMETQRWDGWIDSRRKFEVAGYVYEGKRWISAIRAIENGTNRERKENKPGPVCVQRIAAMQRNMEQTVNVPQFRHKKATIGADNNKIANGRSVKMKYYRELWNTGPIRNEARRLARADLKASFAKKGANLELLSPGAIENAVTVLVFNSENVYLKRAKWNLKL